MVLQVLYMFLDFFSKFDWEKYCLSLQGPVSLAKLPALKRKCQNTRHSM